jgi:Magnesium chelatase, subunit ChlI
LACPVSAPSDSTLAHRGVLLLDELPAFPRSVLEALRQPLEDGVVATDKLRKQARKALEQALSSDDERVRFQAARSLYSYAATKPPSEEEEPEPKALADLGRAWLRGLNALEQPALEDALDRPSWNLICSVANRDPELKLSYERFVAQLAELAARKKLGAGRRNLGVEGPLAATHRAGLEGVGIASPLSVFSSCAITRRDPRSQARPLPQARPLRGGRTLGGNPCRLHPPRPRRRRS